MTALIGAVFVASLLGSLHCAGMCGAFVAFAVAAGGRSGGRAVLHGAYHGGRLMTYAALGAASGALGAAVDLGGAAIGVQRGAAILAGALMIGFGLVAILRLAGARIRRVPLPPGVRGVVARGHRAVAGWSPAWRALAVGLLTTLLPCGWLYAFAITAAGTASPLLGAATMAAFWAGTLPVMVTLGAGVQALAGPLRRRLPLVTSLLLIGVGAYTVAGRLALPTMASPGDTASVSSDAEALARVRALDSTEASCCTSHEHDAR